jgi:hypothetical protein
MKHLMAAGAMLMIMAFGFVFPFRYKIVVDPQQPGCYTRIDTWTAKAEYCCTSGGQEVCS